MPMKPSLSQPRLATQMIAATFAGVIAVGMLASVTELFVRDGWPMERLAVGERIHSNPLVTGLPLAAQSEDKDGIDLRRVAIQGHVATHRPADDQLTSSTSGASSIRAISASELFRYRPPRRLARQSILEIAAHLAPRNGFARRDDIGKSPLGNVFEVAAPLFLFDLLGDGFQDKTVRCLARTLGNGSDSGLEVI
jgi:hypothetical protein